MNGISIRILKVGVFLLVDHLFECRFTLFSSILRTYLLTFIDMFQQFIFNVFLFLPTSSSNVKEQASTVLKNETSGTIKVEVALG